jgi:hypothetical protein
MVAAAFARPLQRRVLVEEGARYHYGRLMLGRTPALELTRVIDIQAANPKALEAASTPEGRRFLSWSRFPFYVVIDREAEGVVVRIADARYSLGRGGGDWASVEVRLPPAEPAPPATATP